MVSKHLSISSLLFAGCGMLQLTSTAEMMHVAARAAAAG
jgi:hypothetical protein